MFSNCGLLLSFCGKTTKPGQSTLRKSTARAKQSKRKLTYIIWFVLGTAFRIIFFTLVCSLAGPLKRDSHRLKEKVTHCEILDTRGIRRMSCRMKILPTQSNFFSRKVAEQYDHFQLYNYTKSFIN